jgi:hypothetical protein
MRGILIGLTSLAVGCSSPLASGGDPDAAVGDGAGGTDGGSGAFTCRAKVTAPTNGHHNPGQDCMNSCHNHNFVIGGTLYTAPTGGTGLGGATITVTDATGMSFDMISNSNGNFYTAITPAYPISVVVSACPSIATMTATIPAINNRIGCNSTSCHSTSAQGHIHLP